MVLVNQKFRILLQGKHFENRTPEILRRIRELSGTTPEDSSFSRLSNNGQAIMANIVGTNTIDQLAASGDRSEEFSHSSTTVDRVVASSSSPTLQPTSIGEDSTLRAIKRLTREIAKLCRSRVTFRHRLHSRSSSSRRFSTAASRSFSVVPATLMV